MPAPSQAQGNIIKALHRPDMPTLSLSLSLSLYLSLSLPPSSPLSVSSSHVGLTAALIPDWMRTKTKLDYWSLRCRNSGTVALSLSPPLGLGGDNCSAILSVLRFVTNCSGCHRLGNHNITQPHLCHSPHISTCLSTQKLSVPPHFKFFMEASLCRYD